MTKRALFAGCNYPRQPDELSGCVNDVTRMRDLLLEMYGFEEDNICFMVDTDGYPNQPTGKNISLHLTQLVNKSEDGDVLFFHFSGHGGQIAGTTGDKEDDGYDEYILPTDGNFLTDDSFREILAHLKPGVSFTFVSDSCHSGGLLDSQELQIGVGEDGKEGNETEPTEEELARRDLPKAGKTVSPETLALILSEKAGHDVSLGTIRSTIYELFREDASPTVKVYVRNMVSRLQECSSEEEWAERYGEVGICALTAFRQTWDNEEIDNDEYFGPALHVSGPFDMSGYAKRKPEGETLPDSAAILISGCESDQLSDDIPDKDGAYGALSNAIRTILLQCEGRITNKQLVNEVRKTMVRSDLDQRPCLYCSNEKVDLNFICEL